MSSQICSRMVPMALGIVFFGVILFTASPAFTQGPLAPPGPPAPTMKTLDQIDAKLEKRTPISKLPFSITAPGSYYLTQNLSLSSGNAITISTDNVSLDLNGFTLSGGGSSQNGIIVSGSRRHVRVYNGSVRRFGGTGVDLGNVVLAEVHSLVVSSNGAVGISAGDQVTMHDCVSRENGGDNFLTFSHATISRCSAVLAAHGNGFSVGTNCSLADCVSDSNVRGYSTGDGCSVHHCVARRNKEFGIYAGNGTTVSDCLAHGQSGTGVGIRVGNDSSVIGCTATSNAGDGVQASNYCQLINNNASENGVFDLNTPSRAGIHLFGTNNRVDSNHVQHNFTVGIKSDDESNDARNIVVRNTVNGNLTNILPETGQFIGPFQNPFDATSPWANFGN